MIMSIYVKLMLTKEDKLMQLKKMYGSGNGANPSNLYFTFWSVFALLYIVGIALPLEVTPHYYNRMPRIWNWTEVMIFFLAVYLVLELLWRMRESASFVTLPENANIYFTCTIFKNFLSLNCSFVRNSPL